MKRRVVGNMLLCCLMATAAVADNPTLALIGDIPYIESTAQQRQLADNISKDPEVGLVLHAGDIKSGSSSCSDSALGRAIAWLNSFDKPLLYTPGDNEWTDCHRKGAGGYHPLERLDFLRQAAFPYPPVTLGQQQLPLESQASDHNFKEFTENRLLLWQGVTIATIHLPGSDNDGRLWNLDLPLQTLAETQTTARDARMRAALHWLNHTMTVASEAGSRAVVVMIHANPALERTLGNPDRPAAYAAFNRAILEAAKTLNRPVLLVHGDYHHYIFDRPGGALYRIQTWGSPRKTWLKLQISADPEKPFRVTQMPYHPPFKKR